ncbi:MAG TPA: DUF3604 domain-containing protein [Steroidobacteraceae bacterium]|nr:DUF3604 domain-containing protein [Steroidobacteraceae bacterium]
MNRYILIAAAGLAIHGSALAASAPERKAYFGDLHLHTTYSFDAYVMVGTKTTPDTAYRFARGEPVEYLGHTVQRRWPLDFLAVTDHSENMGVFNTLEDPDSELSQSDLGKRIREQGATIDRPIFWEIVQLFTSGKQLPGVNARPVTQSTWQKQIEAANRNYRPGTFTTFIGYEWSSMPEGKFNLHRNVIFRGDSAPDPFSSVDSRRPEDLWSYLEQNRARGVEALAIPHNSNASGGYMFDWNDSDGRPIDEAYALRRAANEPLTEISQNKGNSDTSPEASPNDEFANFEVFEHLLVSAAKTTVHGNYVREALGRGLEIEARTGANPYKFGAAGATDFHNGLSTSDENAFNGLEGIDPRKDGPAPEAAKELLGHQTLKDPEHGYDRLENGSGSITGVWAEENTRDSIYSAFRRKETFATSGTRLKLRFFGGWQYGAAALQDARWVERAYARGVSMGADLPKRAADAAAPTFIAWAAKDPDSGNLDRIQVIKVALRNGKAEERIFDVALSGERKIDPMSGKPQPVGNTVDIKTATYKNTIGATQLQVVWTDPEFDASVPALYYLRVLEIPTPRWSTILAAKHGLSPPSGVPTSIQERGWSSPIWYTPARVTRQ